MDHRQPAGAPPADRHRADERLFRDPNLAPPTRLSARKMRATVVHALRWAGLFTALAALPLVVAALGAPAGRGFWLELGSGLGIVGFALLALQFFTTARFRHLATHFGSDSILLFHKHIGIIAFCFILLHPVLLVLSEPRYLEYFDPRVNLLRTLFLVLGMLGLALLVVLPLWRLRFGLSYEWWRLTHAVFAGGVMLVAVAHSLQVGHYVHGLLKQALWVGIGAAALLALAYVRLYKPWRSRQRPYRLAALRDERGDVWTLVLEPDGHPGFAYHGGQYGWLTVGATPFTLQQHPFSFSSSAAAAPRIDITIKAAGDFTSSVPSLQPGSRAFLEGPFGSFTLEAQPQEGAVFIMGGIGITPAMSILRSCRDRGDDRPFLLFYANNTWEEIAFREELDELRRQLNLTVVHVIQDPPPDWTGERGFLDRSMIERHVPADGRDRHFFVCGPPPMMDAVEQALVEMKVPIWNRSIERFQMV